MVSVVLPSAVEGPYRRLAQVLFAVECALFAFLLAMATKLGFEAMADPVVALQRSSTRPALPYVYACPPKEHAHGRAASPAYDFTRDVQAGCSLDVLENAAYMSTVFSNGTVDFRTDGNCSIGIATIKTKSRIVKPYRLRRCIWFKLHETAPIRHRFLFYVVFRTAESFAKEMKQPFKGRLVPKYVFVYFSDYGEASLESNKNYIVSHEGLVARKKNSDIRRFFSKLEDYAVQLPINREASVRVMRVTQISGGLKNVKYPTDGPVTTFNMGDIAAHFLREHGMEDANAGERTGLIVDARIASDEQRLIQQSRWARLLELVASYGGYLSLFGILLSLFFTSKPPSEAPPPAYTLREEWRTLWRMTPWGHPGSAMARCPY